MAGRKPSERPLPVRSASRRTSVLVTASMLVSVGIALGAAGALWTLGTRIVLRPETAAALIGVGVFLGLASGGATLVGVVRRRLLRAVGASAGLCGTVAAIACLAFPAVLYRSLPGEVASLTPSTDETEAWTPRDAPRRVRIVSADAKNGSSGFAQATGSGELEQRLRVLDADILVLHRAGASVQQENRAAWLAGRLGLQAVFARAHGSLRLLGFEEGVAVLSRFPLTNPAVLELGPRRHPFDPRIALVVDVQVDGPGAPPLRVVASQLAPPSRRSEAPGLTEAQTVDLARQLTALRVSESVAGALVIAAELDTAPDRRPPSPLHEGGFVGLLPGGVGPFLLHRESSEWRPLWAEWAPALSHSSTVRSSAAGSPGPSAILAELERAGPPTASRWRGSWQVGLAEDGSPIDRSSLEAAVEEIGRIDGVESVLVVHDGLLVAERYFRGATPERLQNMKSASKGVLSALVGIAIDRGYLGLDDPIVRHLPSTGRLDDPRKGEITVRDLLNMASGLESTSFGAYGNWVSSSDWVRAALERPLVAEPGERFSYSTGDTHLLSAVLTGATGRSTLDFAREHLFEPLGIERVVWERDRQGIYLGGNNLAMRPRDIARFGLLYLDRGRWGDRQIVPWRWIDESTRRNGPSWSRGWGGGYGYLWWIRDPEDRGAYNASGFGGQYLFVSRADDLVVVITSTEISKGRGFRRELFERIRGGIVASVRRPGWESRLELSPVASP